jgi:hypothetical protein
MATTLFAAAPPAEGRARSVGTPPSWSADSGDAGASALSFLPVLSFPALVVERFGPSTCCSSPPSGMSAVAVV